MYIAVTPVDGFSGSLLLGVLDDGVLLEGVELLDGILDDGLEPLQFLLASDDPAKQ